MNLTSEIVSANNLTIFGHLVAYGLIFGLISGLLVRATRWIWR